MAVDINVTRQNGSDAITTISMGVAAAATGLALAQAVGAAGNLALTGTLISGGVYTGTGARRMVAVSTDAGDTTQTLTFTGTDRNGYAITEVLALNGVTIVTTNNDFLTVSRIAVSALTVGNISAGTSAKASGQWITIERAKNCPISIQLRTTLVSGAATWSVEETMDDPMGQNGVSGTGQPYDFPLFPVETFPNVTTNIGGNVPPKVFDDATITAKSATINGTITAPFWAYRLTVTANTGVVQLQGLTALTGMSPR